MKDLLFRGKKLLACNFSSLLFFEIFYQIAVFVIGLELIRVLMNEALKVSGFSNLTAENYAQFLMRPFTLAGLFMGGVVLLFFLTVEISALTVCFHYSALCKKVFINDLFFMGLRQTVRWIRKNPVGWLLVSALSVPFLAGLFLVREVSYVKILQYTLGLFYQAIPNVPVLVLLGVLIFLLSYAILFSLPFILLEENQIWMGIRRGWKVCTSRTWGFFLNGMLLQIIIIFLLAVVRAVFAVAAAIYVWLANAPSVRIPSVLVYSEWIEIASGVLAGTMGILLGTLFAYTAYSSYRERRRGWNLRLPYGQNSYLPVLKKISKRRRAAAMMFFLLVLEVIYVWHLAENKMAISGDLLVGTQITAHRGGAKQAPENTLSSLAAAMASRSDYAEIDVQETQDGVVVLLHDSSLKRTTGVDKNIWEVDYQYLQNLDAGKYFGKNFAGEKIPTLQEAIDFCGKDLKLNVEVKYNGRNEKIVEKVVDLFEKNDLVETAVLSSMNYNFLQEAKELNPHVQTSYVMTMTYGSAIDLIYADYVSVKYSYITQEYVKQAHKLGKMIHAWTVNTGWGVRRMRYYGVDQIITDDPAMAREIVKNSKREKPGFWELVKYML